MPNHPLDNEYEIAAHERLKKETLRLRALASMTSIYSEFLKEAYELRCRGKKVSTDFGIASDGGFGPKRISCKLLFDSRGVCVEWDEEQAEVVRISPREYGKDVSPCKLPNNGQLQEQAILIAKTAISVMY